MTALTNLWRTVVICATCGEPFRAARRADWPGELQVDSSVSWLLIPACAHQGDRGLVIDERWVEVPPGLVQAAIARREGREA